MEQKTKQNLIFWGSISAAALIGLTAGLGIGFGTSNNGEANNQINYDYANNTKGIGVFANLDSFDNNGYNYGVRQGAINYVNSQGGNLGIEEQFTYETMTSLYSNTGIEYVSMLTSLYSTNDIILTSGFQTLQSFTGYVDPTGENSFDGLFTKIDGTNTEYANSDEKAVALLDGGPLSTMYSNAASVSYAAEGAGFMAGIASAAYTEYDAKTNHADDVDYTPNIVMWGGLPLNTVYNFMSGFEQSIKYYNEQRDIDIVLWSGGLADGDSVENDALNINGGQANSDHWYSGGFDSDENITNAKVAKVKTLNAMESSASVIFPVAGGNSVIAESYLSHNPQTTRLMGVDADATLSSSHPDLYIGTATKNLELGGEYAIWAMDDFNGNGVRNMEELKKLGYDGYILLNPADEFFIQEGENLVKWHDEGLLSLEGEEELGAEFRGDINTDGVGLIIGGSNGNNNDIITSFNYLTESALNNSEDIVQFIKGIAISQDLIFDSETFLDTTF